MSKSDLIDAVIAATPGTSRGSASTVVDAVFGAISAKLGKGEGFRIPGFGYFSVKDRAARKGRNPATGVSIDIPESRRVAFAAGTELRTLVAPRSKPRPSRGATATGKPKATGSGKAAPDARPSSEAVPGRRRA